MSKYPNYRFRNWLLLFAIGFGSLSIAFSFIRYEMGFYPIASLYRMFNYHNKHSSQYIAIISVVFGIVGSYWIDYCGKFTGYLRWLTMTVAMLITVVITSPLAGMLWDIHDMQHGFVPENYLNKLFLGMVSGLKLGWIIVLDSVPLNLVGLMTGYASLDFIAKLPKRRLLLNMPTRSSVSPPQDLYLSVNGIDTRYWQMGDSGSTLILLHGGNGSVEFWLYNIAILAQHHRVYAIDMVGSGKSDTPDGSYSLTYQAEFLRDFMTAANIDVATLIGNSMGGGIALEFTRLYPDRVNKLVLVDSMGFGKEISLGIRLITLPAIVWLLRPRRWMIPTMIRSNFYYSTQLLAEWIEIRYPIFAIPDRNRVILRIGQSNFNLAGVLPKVYQPILDNLPNITQPTLIIWGEFDRIIPVKHAYIADENIPNSQLHIFPNCGHHPYLEYPDEFNKLLLYFL